MDRPPPEHPRRRRLGFLILALLIPAVLGYAVTGRALLPQFEARVVALRAAGQPVTLGDLPGSRPPPTALAKEAIELDQAIERLADRIAPGGSALPWLTPSPTNHALIQLLEERRRELHRLMASDAALEVLIEIQSRSRISIEGGSVMNAENFLLEASVLNLEAGRTADALDCFTDAVRLRTIPRATRSAFLFLSSGQAYFRALLPMLEHGKLDPAQLLRLQQSLHQLEQAPLLRDYLLLDRVHLIADIPALAAAGTDSFIEPGGGHNPILGWFRWFRRQALVRTGFFDHAAGLALDNYATQLEALEQLGSPATPPGIKGYFARMRSERSSDRDLHLAPPVFIREGALLMKTHARLGLLGTAVERYRHDHAAAFPATPANLVPQYLPILPTDPFSGGAATFHRMGAGVAIGFDRSGLKGTNAPATTEPGGPDALLLLAH